jgi:hypothetical protein
LRFLVLLAFREEFQESLKAELIFDIINDISLLSLRGIYGFFYLLRFQRLCFLKIIHVDNIELFDELKEAKKKGVKRFEGVDAGQEIEFSVFWIVELLDHAQLP